MSLSLLYIFFFKQKTAYEMRISDWSSDVCSSDLVRTRPSSFTSVALVAIYGLHPSNDLQCGGKRSRIQAQCCIVCLIQLSAQQKYRKIGRASCRERVCQYV